MNTSTAHFYLPTNTAKGMYLKSEVHAFHHSNKYYFLYTMYMPKSKIFRKSLDFTNAEGK